MKTIITRLLAIPALALGLALPAGAQSLTGTACGSGDVSGAGSFLSCAGYFLGNLNGGSSKTDAQVSSILSGMGLSDYTTANSNITKFSVDSGVYTVDFGQKLTGVVALGFHIGNADPKNGTAFYVFDASKLAAQTSAIQFTSNLSLSNAELYGVNLNYIAPVPEPGTWSLLMAGLGAMGFVARRRRPSRA